MSPERFHDEVSARKAYIRELYYCVGNSNSPFTIEWLHYCIKDEKIKLKKFLERKKLLSTNTL